MVLVAHTQCLYQPKIEMIVRGDNAFIIRWTVKPTPNSGFLNLYRADFGRNNRTQVNKKPITIEPSDEYNDTEINRMKSYTYYLELNKEGCSCFFDTKPPAFDADSTTEEAIIKDFKNLSIQNVYLIEPEKLKTTQNSILTVSWSITDANIPLNSNPEYFYLVFGDTLYKAEYKIEKDYRKAAIIIPHPFSKEKKFRIARVQDDTILGISPFIELE